jgi:C-terminal processing protease CtpA/Prc
LPKYYEAINELIQEHHEVLINTPNLVLDLRGNGGGSDQCFNILLPYVCPESINVVGADVRATQGNIDWTIFCFTKHNKVHMGSARFVD